MSGFGISAPTPRLSADLCSLRAQVRGDAMIGTAFPAARLLLIEQPGPWGSDGITQSAFDQQLAQQVRARAQAAGMRIQLLRRPGRNDGDEPRRWAVADTRDGQESLRWGRFLHDADLLDLPLDGSTGEPDTEPLFLVCAHGRHDQCCALRGRPVAAALHALRPDRVWETTHTGGDRFAANVLVLPAGLQYGRVVEDVVADLVAASENGEVLLENLRGRVGHPPVAQAALAFGYGELGVRRGLRVRDATAVADGSARVRLTGVADLDVTVQVESVPAAGLTCGNPGPNRFLRYHATRTA